MPPSSDGLKRGLCKVNTQKCWVDNRRAYMDQLGEGVLFMDDIFLRRLILVRVSTQKYIQL